MQWPQVNRDQSGTAGRCRQGPKSFVLGVGTQQSRPSWLVRVEEAISIIWATFGAARRQKSKIGDIVPKSRRNRLVQPLRESPGSGEQNEHKNVVEIARLQGLSGPNAWAGWSSEKEGARAADTEATRKRVARRKGGSPGTTRIQQKFNGISFETGVCIKAPAARVAVRFMKRCIRSP